MVLAEGLSRFIYEDPDGDFALPFEIRGVKIYWLGHDSFRITDTKTIYIDPYKIKGGPRADIILITHEHFDHLDQPSITKVASPNTAVLAAEPCRGALGGLGLRDVRYVRPGDELNLGEVKVKVIPAYNLNKFKQPGVVFHPKNAGGVGYFITFKDVTIYHTGDSDHIPEMRGLRPEVSLMPVSGTYVMTADEAAKAVSDLETRIAIPMHYGAIVGSAKDAQEFKRLAGCEVVILPKEE